MLLASIYNFWIYNFVSYTNYNCGCTSKSYAGEREERSSLYIRNYILRIGLQKFLSPTKSSSSVIFGHIQNSDLFQPYLLEGEKKKEKRKENKPSLIIITTQSYRTVNEEKEKYILCIPHKGKQKHKRATERNF